MQVNSALCECMQGMDDYAEYFQVVRLHEYRLIGRVHRLQTEKGVGAQLFNGKFSVDGSDNYIAMRRSFRLIDDQ